MGKRRTSDQWLEIIEECRASGYNDKDWCQMHNIPLSSFYTNLKKLRQLAEIDEPPSPKTIIQDPQDVVQVNLEKQPDEHFTQNTNDVALHLNIRGISIDVLNGASKATIENTLSVLRSLC